MTLRKALSLLLVAAIGMVGLPAFAAQDFGPNTVWGEVPQGTLGNAANAVLQDAGGRVVGTIPVIDGKFAFREVAPGDYVVLVQDGASKTLATSEPISFTSGATMRAVFGASRAAAAAPVAAAGATGGGIGTTAYIVAGAVAAGIVTAVVVVTDDDEGPASPTR